MSAITFDVPNAGQALDQLTKEQIDALPFGVVRLSSDGVVELFSKTEARLSGFGERRAVVGRNFFELIAPCMNSDAFRGRIDAERRSGTMDFELGHTGDFEDPSRFMRFRVCSASSGGYWLLVQR
jgi:photoactive yellow protein